MGCKKRSSYFSKEAIEDLEGVLDCSRETEKRDVQGRESIAATLVVLP